MVDNDSSLTNTQCAKKPDVCSFVDEVFCFFFLTLGEFIYNLFFIFSVLKFHTTHLVKGLYSLSYPEHVGSFNLKTFTSEKFISLNIWQFHFSPFLISLFLKHLSGKC